MSSLFNRKERVLKIGKKLNLKRGQRSGETSWRKKHTDYRIRREKELLESLDARGKFNAEAMEGGPVKKVFEETLTEGVVRAGNQAKWYRLSVAIPGSILNNTQSPELRSYVAGEIARSCGIFCVDEVIIFDETATMTDEDLEQYKDGSWRGTERLTEENIECNFHLAKILEYLECPQYLRKQLFPIMRPLRLAGVMNPLDGMHHLRADDLSIPYREGVVVDRLARQGVGSICDVGLEKELELSDELPPKTRVTVKLDLGSQESRRLRGKLISKKAVRKEAGIYWGYDIRIAKSLSDVLTKRYDQVIGTSERGTPIDELPVTYKKKSRILVIFGGLKGLEAAVKADKSISAPNPAEYFAHYVNSLVDQGSRIIRTEEAIPITLTALKYRLNSFG